MMRAPVRSPAPLLFALLTMAACAGAERPAEMTRTTHPDYTADRHIAEALPALRNSCGILAERQGAAWRPVCAALADLPDDDEAVRAFLDRWLVAVPVTAANGGRDGLFTGYYVPSLHGSWQPTATYRYPLYAPSGGSGTLPTRAEIEDGALDGRGLEILWLDDPVDRFFLHIQGSGRVEMTDGSTVGVGFAGRNGHPYFAVGRALIDWGEATPETMSMAFIRDWMEANPARAQDLMNLNASYIFFEAHPDTGATGALGVPLTPGRSLAVDRDHIRLGTPLWVELESVPTDDTPFSRLMVAQDTGSAIQGAVRGDVFWGYGEAAGAIAGAMRSQGRYWVLRPKAGS